jgi:flagellar assembly factor FliW
MTVSLPVAPSAAPVDEIEIASDLLGHLAVPTEAIVDFPKGIPGFAEQRRFALLPAGRPGLHWLQSADVSGLIFLLADAFHWFPEYDIDVPDAELATLDVRVPAELAVFAIVTLPAGPGEAASVNLRAPVLVGTTTRRGQQLVLADDRYAVREPLALG